MADMYLVDRCKIYAENARIGIDVTIENNVTIGTPEQPIKNLILGDHIFIGRDSDIRTKNLTIMDYTKINNHAFIFGHNECYIGYNCWFGQNCILDAEGGIHLGNGVGAGAYSQLWSHIRHGDTLIGNKYLSYGKLVAEDDVWFVGHCIVSPITAKKKSMAMVGSVVTKDMEENHIYGGCPAKDLTEHLGAPFVKTTSAQRYLDMRLRLEQFYNLNPTIKKGNIEIVYQIDTYAPFSQFNITDRTYTKLNTSQEVAFMRFLLPTAKFIPNDA